MKSCSNFEREARTFEILLRFLGTKNALRNRVLVYDYIDKIEYVFSSVLLEKFMSTTCSMIIKKTLNTPIIGDMFTEKIFEDLHCEKYDKIEFKYFKKNDVNKNVVIVTLMKKPNYWLSEDGLNLIGEKLCSMLHKVKLNSGKKVIVMSPSKKLFSDTEIKILGTAILNDTAIVSKTTSRCNLVITKWDICDYRRTAVVIKRV